MLQDTVFAEGEGDAYFERNPDSYDAARDPVLAFLGSQPINPRNILEIGAGRGDRLAALHQRYQADVTAIDPSPAAVAYGQKTFPVIKFFAATARSLPLEDEQYDLVIGSFVFHWFDRKSLLTSAAEFDRVLKPDGHLLIADFAPFSPKKIRYHHRPDLEMYTYKQDYPALFLATAGYVLLGQQVLDYRSCIAGSFTASTDIPERERFSITLLRKISGGTYSS
jgi:ubiquinone/menaquinone biosynthesis C-methylase UbiE